MGNRHLPRPSGRQRAPAAGRPSGAGRDPGARTDLVDHGRDHLHRDDLGARRGGRSQLDGASPGGGDGRAADSPVASRGVPGRSDRRRAEATPGHGAPHRSCPERPSARRRDRRRGPVESRSFGGLSRGGRRGAHRAGAQPRAQPGGGSGRRRAGRGRDPAAGRRRRGRRMGAGARPRRGLLPQPSGGHPVGAEAAGGQHARPDRGDRRNPRAVAADSPRGGNPGGRELPSGRLHRGGDRQRLRGASRRSDPGHRHPGALPRQRPDHLHLGVRNPALPGHRDPGDLRFRTADRHDDAGRPVDRDRPPGGRRDHRDREHLPADERRTPTAGRRAPGAGRGRSRRDPGSAEPDPPGHPDRRSRVHSDLLPAGARRTAAAAARARFHRGARSFPGRGTDGHAGARGAVPGPGAGAQGPGTLAPARLPVGLHPDPRLVPLAPLGGAFFIGPAGRARGRPPARAGAQLPAAVQRGVAHRVRGQCARHSARGERSAGKPGRRGAARLSRSRLDEPAHRSGRRRTSTSRA